MNTTDRKIIPQTAERLLLVVAVVAVLLIAFLAYRSGEAFRRSAEQAIVTRQMEDDTNALLLALTNAETGQRGFLLTGEDRYLEPYRRALTEVQPLIDHLARVEADRNRSDLAQRVKRLRPLVKGEVDELAQTIALRRSKRLDAALVVVRNDEVRMAQIRAVCAEMHATTYALSGQERVQVQARSSEAALTAVVGSGVVLVVLIFATVAIELGTHRRRRLVEALQASENRTRESRDWLQTTLASIGDAVITTDASGKITLLNAVAEKITGWTGDEADGKPLEQVFVIRNEDTGREAENPVVKVLREGLIAGLANHTKLIAKDGRHIPIDDSAAPIRSCGGKVAGVVVVFRDITERRAAERREAGQAAEMRRITHLMEPVACFVRDLEGRIVYWNPGATDLYGFTKDEAIGQFSRSLLKTKFPVPLDQICEQVRTAGVWSGELIHTQRDGHILTVASRWALHRDAEGRPSCILEVNLDITRLKEAEEELRLTNEALVRANEDLNQFAFAASHDLQEPLRMITSYSQLLLKGYRGQLDDNASTWVQFITDGTKRMRELLSDLLAYAQVANERRETGEPVDLNRIFQMVRENCILAIDESKAAVTSDALPTIQGQEPHFIQLLQNLVTNALKYRAAGRPPRIHVSAERENGMWRIAVKDNGIGIPSEYHDQIFSVFKRLHGKTIPGTGIGLAICQRVVRRYGGKIWVESAENQGATFYFTLPGENGAAAHRPEPLPDGRGSV